MFLFHEQCLHAKANVITQKPHSPADQSDQQDHPDLHIETQLLMLVYNFFLLETYFHILIIIQTVVSCTCRFEKE